MKKVKGDLDVLRSITSLRSDQTVVSTSSTSRAVTRNDYGIIRFTGSSPSTFTVNDVNTNSFPNGWRLLIVNDGTSSVTVNDNAASLITTVTQGLSVEIVLADNGTAAGTWSVIESSSQISVTDSESIDLTFSNDTVSGDIKLSAASADSNNQLVTLSVETDGVKAQITDERIQDAAGALATSNDGGTSVGGAASIEYDDTNNRLALTQDIRTSASPSFTGLTVNSNVLTISGTLAVEDDSRIDQDLTQDATPTFNQINLSTEPTNNNHAASKLYVDSVAAGLDPKASVFAATTADISATYSAVGGPTGTGSFVSAPTTVDGLTLQTGNRILVKDQSDALQNGIYYVSGSATWYRASDQDGTPSAEVSAGNYTLVESGTVNIGTGWSVIGSGELTLNTDEIVWTKINQASEVTASNGLTKSINDIQLDLNSLTTATVVTTDSIAFIDADDTNNEKKTTLANLITDLDIVTTPSTGNGLLAKTANDTYAARTIQGGNGITVTDGDGISTNPSVAIDLTPDGGLAIDNSSQLRIDLDASSISGTLSVADGGTGLTSVSDGDLIVASGSNTFTTVSLGTNGSIIVGGATPASVAGSALAGAGLSASTGDGTLVINVGAGSGIISNTDDISVDIGSLAGSALTVSGNQLNVNAGTGLEVSSDTIRIAAAAAGNGLSGGGGSAITVGAGSGIIVGSTDVSVDIGSIAGDGIGVTGSTLSLDLNELTGATIDVANDSIVFIDANDTNASRKESVIDLMSAVAGDGLTSSAGVLAANVDGNTIGTSGDELVRLKYSTTFESTGWSTPSAGYSTYSVSGSVHNQGSNPEIALFVAVSGGVEVDIANVTGWESLMVDRVLVDNSTNDIELRVVSDGVVDGRFAGKVVIS